MPKICLYFPKKFADPQWAGRTFILEAPEGDHGHHARLGEWVLGRHPAADITLAIRTISANHAAISYSYASDLWSVQDLGSTNGTRLNGKLLNSKNLAPLAIGDRLHLGSNLIQIVENEQSTEQINGPKTVASLGPMDYQSGLAPSPSPAPAPAPAPAKTYADSVYYAINWLFSANTVSGGAYRMAVVILMVALGLVLLAVL